MEGKADAASRVREAITTSGIQHEVNANGLAVRIDSPNCYGETMDARVLFSDCGKVSLSVRDDLGIRNSLMTPIFESARHRVDELLPEGVSISIFRAPDEQARFDHTERHFHAELDG